MGQPTWTTFFHVTLVGIAIVNLAASYGDFYDSSQNDQDGGTDAQVFVGLVTQPRTTNVCDRSFSKVQPKQVFYDDCTRLEDGYFADYNNNCHDYFRCHGGSRFNYSCGTTMQFDTVSASCKENVICHLPSCATRPPNSIIVMPNTDCRLFIRCTSNGHPTVQSCPPGSLFDTVTSSCTTKTNTMVCVDVDPCSDKPDGCYPDQLSGCRRYHRCCNGTAISEQECPHREIFDTTRNRCVPGLRCSNSHRIQCASKPDGYHVLSNSGCSTFQLCKGGTPASGLLQCPAGKLFDVARQCCWEKSSVACGNLVNSEQDTLCSGKVDGYYPDLESRCRTFHYCKNRRVTARLSCAKGRLFDADVGHCTDESTGRCAGQSILGSSDCKGYPDGYHVDVPGGCRRLLYCKLGNRLTETFCPPGERYDQTRLQCKPEHLVRCSNKTDKCSGKHDGYYPDYEDNCQSYYYCQGSRNLVSLQCSSGTMFDESSRSCVGRGTVTCKAGISNRDFALTNSRCWGRSDGLYADTLKGCKEYVRCRQGVLAARYQCYKGRLFDSTVQTCVPDMGLKCSDERNGFCWKLPDGRYTDYASGCAYQYDCRSGLTSLIPCSTNNTTSTCEALCSPALANCTGVPDGYYPDKNSDSRSFYRCYGGLQIFRGHCLENLSFDVESSSCQSPKQLNYPITSMCTSKQNGFYPDRDTNCSRYYLCMEEKMVQTTDCPSGEIFDTARQYCLPRNEASCLTSSENKWHDCTGKLGFYADVQDNCRGFYVCLPGNQSLAYQCPTGQMYSNISKKCEHESDVQCAEDPIEQVDVGNSFSCKDKPDGYYTDIGSGCRRWYECQAADAAAYQCPSGRVFNILYRRCDHPSRVECVDERWVFKNYSAHVQLVQQARTATDTPATTQTNCAMVPNGIYVNVQKGVCQSVSVCVNGQSTYVQCPQELLNAKNCTVPGIYVDAEDRCKSFNICDHGVLTSHSCPPDLIFNTKLRRCERASEELCRNQPRFASLPVTGNKVSLFKTPPDPESVPPSPFDCSGKPDGFYPDYEQGCHVFYRCVAERKYSHYCNVGLLFNPEQQNCDLQENVNCKEPVPPQLTDLQK